MFGRLQAVKNMQIKIPHEWRIPDRDVTPESRYLHRREFLRTLGLGLIGAAFIPRWAMAATAGFPDALNPTYKLDGVTLTPFDSMPATVTSTNSPSVSPGPRCSPTRVEETEHQTVEIGGLCRNPGKYGVNDLVRLVGGIEQRNYRHRCVEAWSMVIPWDGFPLQKSSYQVCGAETGNKVGRVHLVSRHAMAAGQKDSSAPQPYTEGLTIAEANNELPRFSPPACTASRCPIKTARPSRSSIPWKYGFMGGKSIVQIDFVTDQPQDPLESARPE